MTISLTVTGARSQGSGTTNGTSSYTLSVSGLRGQSAYTLTTAAYTQPAVSATVTVSVQSSSWLAVGSLVHTPGGDYEVTALPASTSVTLQNLGYPGAASPGAMVASGSSVTATGARGADGADGAAGAPGPPGADGDPGPQGPRGTGGAWLAGEAYAAGDVVSEGSAVYVALAATTGEQPSTHPAAWSVLDVTLPDVGPGAGTVGGSGSCVQSVTLDTKGRVTTVTAASIAGDVSGSIDALSVDKIKGSTLPTAPASGDAGRILVVSGANAWRYGRYREYETTFSLVGNSGTTNGPTLLFTFPTRFKLAEAFASLTTAIAGTGGTSTFRLGSTSGGQEILLDWAIIVGTTAVGTLWGDQPATERGTDMLAGRGFGAYYSASQSVYARSVASGANITAGVVTILLCGWEIP